MACTLSKVYLVQDIYGTFTMVVEEQTPISRGCVSPLFPNIKLCSYQFLLGLFYYFCSVGNQPMAMYMLGN